ncbi:MAG: DUF1993 domain-containing protein [Methyloceanibacter sp.]|jgi:uncharacterized protein
MSLSMYQASVPAFLKMLNNLSSFLEKADAFATERKIDAGVLLNWRLAPDMFALVRQVQIAADFAKGTPARLAGVEVPKYADEETTFAELKQRIAKTVTFVQGFKPADIDGSEDRDITLMVGGQEMRFKGQPYLLHFALPNFYFHVTTAYDVLRACGVGLGKRDFIGTI